MNNSKLSIFLVVICFMASCKHDSAVVYPASVGNEWDYHFLMTADTPYASYQHDMWWKVVKDTTINGVATQQFLTIDSDYYSGKKSWQNNYYISSNQGFYLFGADSPIAEELLEFKKNLFYGSQLPTSPSFKTVNTFNVFVPTTPLQLLKFPISIGDTWNSNEYGTASNYKRKYLGVETITTPAGTFPCTKIQCFFDQNNDGIRDSTAPYTYEWYCDKGFVMRLDSQFVDDLGHPISNFQTQIILQNIKGK